MANVVLSTRAFRAHAPLSQPLKTKKGPPSGDPFLFFLVEAAGVEPIFRKPIKTTTYDAVSTRLCLRM